MSVLECTDQHGNNCNRIFRYVYGSEQPVTKQDIVTALRLSLPTVTMNLNRLLEENLLQYGDTIASTGGRKPRAIGVVAQARTAIGVSIRERSILMVSVDLKLNEVAYERKEIPFEDRDTYYQTLASLLEGFIDAHQLPRERILGVGVALPGIINEEDDQVEFSPRLRLRKKKLADIRKLFPHNVFFVNDANARGFVEWWNHPEHGSIAYLSVDQGVGGSIVLGSVPYLGENGRSAEFGHMRVVSGGRLCSCGQNGCLEAYCSVSRLSDEQGCTLEEFFSRLDAGEPQARVVWRDYVTRLAQGIVNIRSVLDCEIVLGGTLSLHMESHMRELCELVAKLNPLEKDGSFIRLCKYRTRSSGVGAALHFISAFIQAV